MCSSTSKGSLACCLSRNHSLLRTTVVGDTRSCSYRPLSELKRSTLLPLITKPGLLYRPCTVDLEDMMSPFAHKGRYCSSTRPSISSIANKLMKSSAELLSRWHRLLPVVSQPSLPWALAFSCPFTTTILCPKAWAFQTVPTGTQRFLLVLYWQSRSLWSDLRHSGSLLP